MSTFAARLQQAIAQHSPLCVGIDPSASLLKSCGLPDTAEGAFEFGKRVLEAAQYELSIIKPQVAFFERFGSSGIRVLEELTKLSRSRGVMVLSDAKRGDIDTTAEAYAEAYFSPSSPLRTDALTTHAYLGFEALEKFLAIALRNDGGVFVVVRSSNPEGRELQQARLQNGESVAANLSRLITERNARVGSGLGPIGAVVGATCEDAAETADQLPSSFILAPGVGAQGATIQDVLRRMPAARGRVLPNVSRAILANGSTESDIRTTIRAMQEQAKQLL
ncbi:orotidine-5'-phosphate decarboxylase [Povalibacter uvarum]|uniref:Orotidine-5'-phosphate decarboxylase n=1 Tax=Povalibacter uvarum TaxID=732238 RepID=A0A841HKZ5_9GAMM|nr:orotidine-5'-phosphate decarboxylase [Povalibacter uvarum]MBB6093413.1 orotidine-5'-phosphate decarboxylase [Povalibacter uvarum]